MENERTENIFYLDLKHVHKYGCAEFEPNPFSSAQMATEGAAEKKNPTRWKKKNKKKKRKKVSGQDAPITVWHRFRWWTKDLL